MVGYSNWSGLAKVFEVDRQLIEKKTCKMRVEMVYGVTNLLPERGTRERLLGSVR